MTDQPIIPITVTAPREYLDAIMHKLTDLDTDGRGILFIPNEAMARGQSRKEFFGPLIANRNARAAQSSGAE